MTGPSNSHAYSAALARSISRWVQIIFLITLFVLWKVGRWPFWSAAEACVVSGMLLYSLLNIYAALMVAWTGPVFVARVARLVGIVLYVVLRYWYHYGFWQALLVWMGLWIISGFLVMRARRRAVGGAPINISSAS